MLKLTDVLNQKADYWELHIFPHGVGVDDMGHFI